MSQPIRLVKAEAESFTHPSSLSQHSNLRKASSHPISPPHLPQQDSLITAEIAKEVTVRILTEHTSGSGVVIARQGQTYTVLTCQHVVADNKSGNLKVLSADGRTHPARRKSISHLMGVDLGLKILSTDSRNRTHRKSIPRLSGVDLGLVEFESKVPYRVAVLGDSNTLAVNDHLYATGFPNYHFINQNAIEDTRNWGTRAFHLTIGKVSLLSERSLPGGYRLGYTNEVELGMSGGPVLNERGQVVGINGRLKYPLQGIDAFTFADGTKPSEALFEQMEALSWAIPITTFRQIASE